VVALLHVVWSTNLGQKDTPPEPPQTDRPPQPAAKTLPLPLVDEFLCVAFTLIPSLRYTLQQPSTEPAPSVPTCTSFTDMSADQPEAPLTSRLVALVQLQGSITNSYKNWPL
jgi:hypothetical protein